MSVLQPLKQKTKYRTSQASKHHQSISAVNSLPVLGRWKKWQGCWTTSQIFQYKAALSYSCQCLTTQTGEIVLFFLLWINVRLRPAGEGLGSAPSPSPLLKNEVPQYNTAPDDSRTENPNILHHKTVQHYPSWQSLPRNLQTLARDRHTPEAGCRSETQYYNQLHSNLSAHCFSCAAAALNCFTPFNKRWHMPKKWSCTGSKSIVITSPRFFWSWAAGQCH